MIKGAQANDLWTELLNKKGSQWLPVLTGSMSPLIHAGDHVCVSRVTPELVHTGDIVAFRRGDNIITHRVLHKQRSPGGFSFNEKGDNTYSSGVFFAEDLIGRVVMSRRGAETFSFASPFCRLVSFVLGVWFYGTTLLISTLRTSTKKLPRKIGNRLSRLLLGFSNVMIRLSHPTWSFHVDFSARHVESDT